jgi:hypothetical protein
MNAKISVLIGLLVLAMSSALRADPSASISVDNYNSGDTITRPYGGSVTIIVRFGAFDPDGSLSGIRYNVWNSNTWYFDNGGGGFAPQSGSSGEVDQTITLDSDGDWYFWTDAQNSNGASTSTGPWTDGFHLTVVQAPNQPPNPSISVDGHNGGDTITRPYGGSVTVTVRYSANDPDSNLSGIRYNVWNATTGYFDNGGGGFVSQSGSYGEVDKTVTLDSDGDWYFWTDAEDSAGAYASTGPWTGGFHITVAQASPPPPLPVSPAPDPSTALVNIRSLNGQWLYAQNGGGQAVVADQNTPTGWETFTLTDLSNTTLKSGDTIALMAPSGQYLSAEGGGGQNVVANRAVASGWEKFIIYDLSNGGGAINSGDSISIQVNNGQYVSAEGGGGGVINANRNQVQGWETFTIQVNPLTTPIVTNIISVTDPNLPGINAIMCESNFFGYNSAVNRPLTSGQPAYNYSTDLMWDVSGGFYRLYYGGRWFTPPGHPDGDDGDHILQTDSPFGAGYTWPESDHPEFLEGQEGDYPGTWFANNYLQPQVIKVNGTYYMYSQVQIDPGAPIDSSGLVADQMHCDRIQLRTSQDGNSWTTLPQPQPQNRGAIINIDDPTHKQFIDEEMVYVPWDADGRPFWMYVYTNAGVLDSNGKLTNVNPEGHFRIRSADPTTFDWNLREHTWLSQLGNQIGYANAAPGGPLFIRITFKVDETGRTNPSLQFSRDGLDWPNNVILLDGSKDNSNNKNCYFLSLSTQDGTGQLLPVGTDKFQFIYGASTINSPGEPDNNDIYYSEIGAGTCRLTINPTPDALEGKLMECDGLPLALVIGGKRLQFASQVGYLFSNKIVHVDSAFYNSVPYEASLPANAVCIGTSGQPACFVLDDGKKWPVSCSDAITDNGSSITSVSADQYNSYPTGPSLICQ